MKARSLWASALAIEEFRRHWCPGFPPMHAKGELILLCESARRSGVQTRDGKEIWRAGTRGEVRFIVAKDIDSRGFRTVVTVLGPEPGNENGDPRDLP